MHTTDKECYTAAPEHAPATKAQKPALRGFLFVWKKCILNNEHKDTKLMDTNHIRRLAGIPLRESAYDNYTFYIIDPRTAEFTKYYSGSILDIIRHLEADEQNNQIATVIKQQKIDGKNGIISFVYDDHLYAFIPGQ